MKTTDKTKGFSEAKKDAFKCKGRAKRLALVILATATILMGAGCIGKVQNESSDQMVNDNSILSTESVTDSPVNNNGKMTIAETLPSCVAFEYKDGNPYCFYAYDTEGRLYRVLWSDFNGLNEKDVIIVQRNDEIKTLTYEEYPDGGWTPEYEITATGVERVNSNDDPPVSHIHIESGTNTVQPFGSLIWSRTDNGDGTFDDMFADRLDIFDVINVDRYADVIPELVFEEMVSYSVQANGRVENVFLYTPSGDGYTKSETSFDALSSLADRTYYVVLEVLLSGNCDPDAPQNSYRYEDIFCLVVG